MNDILLRRAGDTQRHPHTGKMAKEDKGRKWNDIVKSQRTPRIARCHKKLEERQGEIRAL